jgi:AcrR family transcriptional regulator
VDKEGLPALSMRRLGASLGVDPMAIYHYLPNKAALYDALVEAVMEEIDLSSADAGGDLPDRLKSIARAYRKALLAHPNALSVVSSRPVRTVAALRIVERMLGMLLENGFGPKEAIVAVDACAHFVLGSVQAYVPHLTGSTLHEHDEFPLGALPPEEFPNFHELASKGELEYLDFEEEFEFGIDAMVRGMLAGKKAR